MKRLLALCLAVALVLGLGAVTFASNSVDGSLDEPLSLDIPINVSIEGYVHVMAQRLKYEGLKWDWRNWDNIGFVWSDTEDPLMDFEEFSGRAGQAKFTDSNGFVVETNTDVILTFEGTPLTHTVYTDSKMLTTYWAFRAAGVDEEIAPVPNWRLFPKQVKPVKEIGYFGLGDIPRFDTYESVNFPYDDIIALITLVTSGGRFFPEQEWVHEELPYYGIEKHGIYAFQVFGFASTDGISSQREGNYVGQITLTVSR